MYYRQLNSSFFLEDTKSVLRGNRIWCTVGGSWALLMVENVYLYNEFYSEQSDVVVKVSDIRNF